MEWPITATTKKPAYRPSLGTAIGEGSGNIVIAAEYYDRRAAYEREPRTSFATAGRILQWSAMRPFCKV